MLRYPAMRLARTLIRMVHRPALRRSPRWEPSIAPVCESALSGSRPLASGRNCARWLPDYADAPVPDLAAASGPGAGRAAAGAGATGAGGAAPPTGMPARSAIRREALTAPGSTPGGATVGSAATPDWDARTPADNARLERPVAAAP